MRQRLLRALLSTLGDDAAAATKLRGLHAIRLLLAAFADGCAAAGGSPDDADSTSSRRRGDGSGGGGIRGGSSSDAAAASAAAAGLPWDDWAAAAKKLGKRLEDSSDDIRIAACGALAELARCRVDGPGFSAQQGPDAKADDGKLGSGICEPPLHASPEGKAGGRNGNSEQDAEGLSAVEKLLSSLRLHACDDNPAVVAAAAAAAAAVAQQLQPGDLVMSLA